MYNFNMQTIVFNCSNIHASFKALYLQIIHYNLYKVDICFEALFENITKQLTTCYLQGT